MGFRNCLILLAAISMLISANRTKRDIDALIRGGFKTDFIKSSVAILVNQDPVCSGTLISNVWVLTAGHCVPDNTTTEIEVVAGETNLLVFYQGLSKTGIKATVKNIKLHPKFKWIRTEVLEKDLALLELAKPLDIENNPNIEVAFLPPPSFDKYDKTIRVGGWGFTEKFRMSTNHLSIDITIKKNQLCLTTYSEREYKSEELFCAGSDVETTCRGDSGAGGIFNDWGIPAIVGVVSFGKTGCKTPSVYNDVAKFLPWIFKETKLKPANFMDYISSCLPPNRGCDSTWTQFGSHCYKYFAEEKITWPEAKARCEQEGGHLTSIHSAEENQFLVNLSPQNSRVLIGGNDLDAEGTFLWTDGSAWKYRNWRPGQPSNTDPSNGVYFGGEHCAEIGWGVETLWNDLPCKFPLGEFICKKK